MATSKSSAATAGVYSSTSEPSDRSLSAWAGAMPSSISNPTRSRTSRWSASRSAQATSKRLWLATPMRTESVRSGVSIQSRQRLKLASVSALVG